MSNTATQISGGFKEAKVQKLPTLSCIGYVSEVGEGKLASTGNYVVQPFTLESNFSLPRHLQSIKDRMLYRPEWLGAEFDPSSMEEYDGGENMISVYRRNIAVKGGISKLKGLSGSEANYIAIAGILMGLEDHNIPTVESALRNFFVGDSEERIEVGYDLTQRRDKVGEDDNGRGVYELANGYEVGRYWFPTPENQKKKRLQAKKATDGLFRVAFEESEE